LKKEGQIPAPPKRRRQIPGFRLKDPSEPKPATLLQLEEMFGDSVSGEVIEQVHAQMADLHACVEALMELSSEPSKATLQNSAPDSSTQRSSPAETGPTAKKSLWDSLPPDCQLLIVDSLTAKHLAGAAPTCKSFARLAALRFGNMDVIRCRRGCSFKSLPGMIASHKRATQVCIHQPLSVHSWRQLASQRTKLTVRIHCSCH
jgi:hypothetical protein